jgi:putative DNA primase/helicase
MTSASLHEIARALGGKVIRDQILAPGPGHSSKDLSLSVRLSSASRDGFIAHSFAGEDWKLCRDYVRERLGLARGSWRREKPRPTLRVIQQSSRAPEPNDRGRAAIELWRASVEPRGTLVERYLSYRRLELGDDIAGTVLRWHAGIGAMVALLRNIQTNEPQSISRTFLDKDGNKLERKFLGPVGGAAIKLDADENVHSGLYIGEGVETCLAARQIGLKPTWALGSCMAIGAFPVLSGIECLSILRERDEANRRNADACAMRWHSAGRCVFNVKPNVGKDINDAIRGVA